MAVVPRETKKGTVYWVVTRGHMEKAGSGFDRRAADRLDERRKKEVKAGTFTPGMSSATSVGTFLREWLEKRDGRSARVERSYLVHHVFGRGWFLKLRMDDVAPKHIQRLIEEIRDESKLTHKTILNVFAVLRAAFRAAQRKDLTHRNVCMLDPGTLAVRQVDRVPYTVDEVRALLASTTGARRVWLALAFYTGMRCGEICGRRWRDWDAGSAPLGCLTIATQYDDLPLKTDNPRRAPVHPALVAILADWRASGFELLHRRKPRPDDFIVPRYSEADCVAEDSHAMTQNGAYWAWGRDCERAGVQNRTQHAARHTFVTLTRRGGADTEVVEKITHNAKGTIVDNYTHRNWSELCAVVMCLPDFDPDSGGPGFGTSAGSDRETSTNSAVHGSAAARNSARKSALSGQLSATEAHADPAFLSGDPIGGAILGASQESEAHDFATALAEVSDHGRATEIARPLRKASSPYIARDRAIRSAVTAARSAGKLGAR